MTIRAAAALSTIVVMFAVQTSTAAAQCNLGEGFGVGGVNFEELNCAGMINSMPAGGDGGVPAATTNLAVFEDAQYVGTRVVVRFDKFHITSGDESFTILQQRTRDQKWQMAGIYTLGPSLWHKHATPPHSTTWVKSFIYVPGSAIVRSGRSFLVKDKAISTVGMYFRLSAPSACAIQNYKTFGSPPYCTPSIAHWEFSYWTTTDPS